MMILCQWSKKNLRIPLKLPQLLQVTWWVNFAGFLYMASYILAHVQANDTLPIDQEVSQTLGMNLLKQQHYYPHLAQLRILK